MSCSCWEIYWLISNISISSYQAQHWPILFRRALLFRVVSSIRFNTGTFQYTSLCTPRAPRCWTLHAVLVTVSAQWRPAPDSWLLVRDTAVVTRGHQRGPGMGDMGALAPGWESALCAGYSVCKLVSQSFTLMHFINDTIRCFVCQL